MFTSRKSLPSIESPRTPQYEQIERKIREALGCSVCVQEHLTRVCRGQCLLSADGLR